METISHRQLRNESGEVLRRASDGESILVTNNGRPAAIIGPPPNDVLAELTAHGQVRRATEPTSALQKVKRKVSAKSSAGIVADVRGKW